MPLEIKDKRTGKVQACAVTSNTLKCGHCNFDVLDDQIWLALDDPYHCLIHQTCLGQFNFDGMARSKRGEGRERAVQAMCDNQRKIIQMMSRPWWKNSKATREYHAALMNILLLHESLRSSGILDVARGPPAPEEETAAENKL